MIIRTRDLLSNPDAYFNTILTMYIIAMIMIVVANIDGSVYYPIIISNVINLFMLNIVKRLNPNFPMINRVMKVVLFVTILIVLKVMYLFFY